MTNKKNKTITLEDLVPPFVNGDWVTANTKTGLSVLRLNAGDVAVPLPKIVPLAGVAEFVGRISCSSGWALFGIDSSHFRKVTYDDVRHEIARMNGLKDDIEAHLEVLMRLLNDIQQFEEL